MRSRLIAAGFVVLTVVLTLSSCNHGGATPLPANSTPQRGQGCTVLAGMADKAGLKPGDVVTAADGQVVQSCDQLTAILQHHAPGDRIPVTYHRSGTSHETTTTVTLGGSGPCPGNVGGVCASPVTSSPVEVSGP
jgi:putative serine protease PepD